MYFVAFPVFCQNILHANYSKKKVYKIMKRKIINISAYSAMNLLSAVFFSCSVLSIFFFSFFQILYSKLLLLFFRIRNIVRQENAYLILKSQKEIVCWLANVMFIIYFRLYMKNCAIMLKNSSRITQNYLFLL